MTETSPMILVQYLRDGLIEQEHSGFLLMGNKSRIIERYGKDKNYPFFLRSCAKPLQASLLIDFGMDKYFNMTEEEIALCCASHAGEQIHTDIARGLMKKIGIKESELKCGLHEPLSKTERQRLIKENKPVNILHNNCSGKHIMMLGLCVMKGWDKLSYDDIYHPLQFEIKEKIYSLCGVKKEYPVTSDGCGVPIMAVPLPNMLKGYLNLFCNPVYEKIKNAFLNQPYIIGGEDRLDTKIMQNSEGLVAKVGAGGLCIVVNTSTQEAFVVKISDSDMKAREYVVLDMLRKLRWADIPTSREIKTIHNKIVGEVITLLSR